MVRFPFIQRILINNQRLYSITIDTELLPISPIYSTYIDNIIAYSFIPYGAICNTSPGFCQFDAQFKIIFVMILAFTHHMELTISR